MRLSPIAVFLTSFFLDSTIEVSYATPNLPRECARGCLGSTCISPVWLEACKTVTHLSLIGARSLFG